jgi:Zn-finger nucleic acid-binding protein
MMDCPDCRVSMVDVALGGERVAHCERCGAVWLARAAVLRLRDLDGAERSRHPLLSAQKSEGEQREAQRTRPERACPDCGEPMQSFRYRGGAHVVERCGPCDALLLDRGELGQILEEWQQGLEVSAEAQAVLDAQRATHGLQGWLASDGSRALAGLAAAAVFAFVVWALFDLARWTVVLPIAATLAVGAYLRARRRARRERHAAQQQLRALEQQRRPSASPPAPRDDLFAPCPWCGARIPRDSQRCRACDSDL